jgi:hypothetical protein
MMDLVAINVTASVTPLKREVKKSALLFIRPPVATLLFCAAK